MTYEALAPAKVNLTLHITSRRADGYHLLDSFVVFTALGDRLWFEPSDRMEMQVTGPFAEGVPTDTGNLVWQAAEAVGVKGSIKLEKNLPHGGGIGSASADAAALLRCLTAADGTAAIGTQGALQLGADVPVCLNTYPQRMGGTGEVLSSVTPVPRLNLVLINPRIHVATPQVFAALDARDNAPMKGCDGWADLSGFLSWLSNQRNDMQRAAMSLVPAIADVIEALNDAALTRMSGSGATCFGIYETAADAENAAWRIARDHPDWWVVATHTLDGIS